MPARLEGKVTMITGAAGGIGAATARSFALVGAALLLTDAPRGARRSRTTSPARRAAGARRALAAIGMGCSLVPSTIVAREGLAGSQSGLGSGLNTSRLMGGALGLAVLSTIASTQTRADRGLSSAHALTNGFDLAFAVGALFTLAGALAAALLLRARPGAVLAPLPAPAGDTHERERDARERDVLAA